MYQLVQNKSMKFDISLYDTFFKRFDRVRIDEIKVYITGIKTRSRNIQVNIETGTIFQDKLIGEKFTFHANSWQRTFRYKSKASTAENRVMSLVISITILPKTLITQVSLLNGLFCYPQKKKKRFRSLVNNTSRYFVQWEPDTIRIQSFKAKHFRHGLS